MYVCVFLFHSTSYEQWETTRTELEKNPCINAWGKESFSLKMYEKIKKKQNNNYLTSAAEKNQNGDVIEKQIKTYLTSVAVH